MLRFKLIDLNDINRNNFVDLVDIMCTNLRKGKLVRESEDDF